MGEVSQLFRRAPLSAERKLKIGAASKAAHARKRDRLLQTIADTGCIKCAKCKQDKPLHEYPKDNRRVTGLRARCHTCTKEYYAKKSNEYYHNNKDKIVPKRFWYYKKSTHGVTKEQYLAFLEAQHGTCAICKKPPAAEPLVIDHNHANGEFRGLLCRNCNTGLGLLGDSALVLRNATEYLLERGSYGA